MAESTGTLTATGAMCQVKPFLEPLAFALLEDIRAYFQDPENEAEFQKWKEEQERKGA